MIADTPSTVHVDLEPAWALGQPFICTVRTMTMPSAIPVYRGTIHNRVCTLPFRVRGTTITGTALLDTGSQHGLIALAFAERHGLKPDSTRPARLHGVGESRQVPTAPLNIELPSTEGPSLTLVSEYGVSALPPGIDFVVGANALMLGVFTYNGPAGTWEWRVTDPHRVVPPLERAA